jgi:hypothetical protein
MKRPFFKEAGRKPRLSTTVRGAITVNYSVLDITKGPWRSHQPHAFFDVESNMAKANFVAFEVNRYPSVQSCEHACTWFRIQTNLGLAHNTLQAYGRALNDFLVFTSKSGASIVAASCEHISAWVRDRWVVEIGEWRPDIRLNETTGTYFRRLAAISPPEQARVYRDVLSPDQKVARAADDWLFANEPRHSSMLRTSVSPNIFTGGYRSNVIPSEAKATLDVRALPDEDPAKFLELVKKVVNDPAVEVRFTGESIRPAGPDAKLDSEAYKALESAGTRIYNAPTLPMMSTGATDMAQLRVKGVQCFGIGPAVDFEDAPKGFGAHSDQERLLESELHRFVRFTWEVVTDLARTR